MANKRIQDLVDVGSFDGTEEFPLDKGGITKKGSVNKIKTFLETALNTTFEVSSNKEALTLTDSATKYPSSKAIMAHVLSQVTGTYDDVSDFNASTGSFPTSGSGVGGYVMRADCYPVTVAGTVAGVSMKIGDILKAKIDNPAQVAANWTVIRNGVSYVPEDSANKGVANGYAGLDDNGKIKLSVVPIVPIPNYLSFRKLGAGTGIVAFDLTSQITGNVEVTNGFLCDGANGANPTIIKPIIKNNQTTFYLKCTKNNCIVKCYNIVRASSSTTDINAPSLYFSPANLPAGLTLLSWGGQNTGTGDIANLPAGLTFLSWYGQNTGTGNVANLPAGLTYLEWGGQNTGTGDIANLPAGLTYLGWYGQNTGTFSGDRIWAQNMRYVRIAPKSAGIFTSAMTDNLLISLSKQSVWTIEKAIDLRGNCGARTSASDSAVTLLRSYGVTVLTN